MKLYFNVIKNKFKQKNRIYLFIVFLSILFIFIFPKNAQAECCSLPPFEGQTEPRCTAAMDKTACETYGGQYFINLICNEMTNRCVCPDKTLCLQVPFPGAKNIEKTAVNNTEGLLGKYIFAMYQFLIWIAISLAIFMIMLAGFIWLMSAGNQGLIGKAKGYITNALYGLIIVLASYLILISINPRLIENKMPTVPKPPIVATAVGNQCCYNEATNKYKPNIKLLDGQTCQDAFSLLGGTWERCGGTACVCSIDYRPQGGALHSLHCDNGVSEIDCNKLTTKSPPSTCTFYNDTACEVLSAQGKIGDYTPYGVLRFRGSR